MGKKREKKEKEIIAIFHLSTGYEVPIELKNDRLEGIEHLTQALFGEIGLPALKQGEQENIANILTKEITDCVQKLSDREKNVLLSTIIWEFFIEKWKEIEKKVQNYS